MKHHTTVNVRFMVDCVLHTATRLSVFSDYLCQNHVFVLIFEIPIAVLRKWTVFYPLHNCIWIQNQLPMKWQENYVNYKPSSAGRDDNGLKRMSLIARAAESIADGDIINVQIRRYRQWQLSQSSSLSSCIIP